MRIYFNTSALNRPFDDQSVDCVRLEAEAVAILLAEVESGRAEWVASDYLEFGPFEPLVRLVQPIVEAPRIDVMASRIFPISAGF